MAGHRQGHQRRDRARQERMSRRLGSAATAEQQLAAAYDHFRMSVRRVSDAAVRAQLIRKHAEALHLDAVMIDGGSHGHD
jgi:hypothetical protein